MYKIPKQSYVIEFKQEAVRQVEVDNKSPIVNAMSTRCKRCAACWG